MSHRFAALSLAAALAAALCTVQASAEPAKYVQDELLVGVTPNAAVRSAAGPLDSTSFRIVGQHPQLGVFRVKVARGLSLAGAAERLRMRGDVLFVEPNGIYHASATPNDPSFGSQWAPRKVQADLAWPMWTPKAQVVVAIVDTGIDYTHPDLTNKVLRSSGTVVGYNAVGSNAHTGNTADPIDDQGHGTHCAGIAAAQIDNSTGVAGISGWNGVAGSTDVSTKLMPVKVLDSTGSGTDATVAAGITWAADHGAKVISLSLGGGGSTTLSNAVSYAWNKGCVVVAAAGNSSSSALSYPAAYPNVLAVAATDSTDTLASYSNYGSWVNVAAPGSTIYSTLPTYAAGGNFGTNYGYLSGTSMATPNVAGEAALLLAQNPALANSQIRSIIIGYVDAYTPYSGRTIATAAGRINVYHALQAAGGQVSIPAAPTALTTTAGNGQVSLSWTASSGATSYNVLRSTTNGGGYAAVATGVTTTGYTNTGLTNGTTYYYVVTATNSAGTSGYSNQASATPAAPVPGTFATFVNTDTTTRGSWKGVYGSAGYSIAQLSGGTSLPAYALWSVAGNSNWTWVGSTTDGRALQKVSTTDRIAACWYGSAFTGSLNLTDGLTHQVALYFLDWDSNTRAETVDVLDTATGQVLNSQPVSGFNGGKWLIWSVKGNVTFRITRTGGANAVLSGMFLK
jgi:thermitase